MFKRKLITLFLASILSISLISSYYVVTDGAPFFSVVSVIGLFAAPFLLLYGLPVSCLSDKLTELLYGKSRLGLSFVLHVSFGFSFLFIVGFIFDSQSILTDFGQFFTMNRDIFIASIFTSVCFWTIDEGIKVCPLIE
ncbi:hypothetical protein NC661_21120 [Aquibacillus koreensis]|uniref:Uncharacterized protein n=1 Tax=Aquibacillus koreensis TaxID=279446 RepID=A0A9X3WQ74_9BACI|nr:hypothetical protein [Aquibacillus koreensis]MCT2535310.1 hypothetical protein [Aquibacillus koreensis]MDC3422848.1 hypothetical protein [Aquibacillus koreensis]